VYAVIFPTSIFCLEAAPILEMGLLSVAMSEINPNGYNCPMDAIGGDFDGVGLKVSRPITSSNDL